MATAIKVIVTVWNVIMILLIAWWSRAMTWKSDKFNLTSFWTMAAMYGAAIGLIWS